MRWAVCGRLLAQICKADLTRKSPVLRRDSLLSDLRAEEESKEGSHSTIAEYGLSLIESP